MPLAPKLPNKPQLPPQPLRPVELLPGDVVAGTVGESYKTLLGSCVSVILTDPHRTVGAMCHIVHVGQPNAANQHNTAYGAVAFHAMFMRLQKIGVTPHLCEAYVFGGGNMFPEHFNSAQHVGANNSEWVLLQLEWQRIRVVDMHVGGNGYRKVSWTVGPTEPLVETVFPERGAGYDR